MKLPKKLIKGVTVFMVVGLAAYVVYVRLIPQMGFFNKEEPEMPAPKATVEKQELVVQAGQAIMSDLIKRINGSGLVEPFIDIQVRARSSGDVLDVLVKEGQWVTKGDLLFVIDSTDRYLTFKERETARMNATTKFLIESGALSEVEDNGTSLLEEQYEQYIAGATKEWNEAEEFLKSGMIDQKEYDIRKLNYDIAQGIAGANRQTIRASQWNIISSINAYERAKIDLANTKAYAPISGVVAQLDIQRGQEIGTGTVTMRILDDRKLRVVIGVLEPEVADLELGRQAKVSLSAFQNEEFSGYVESISPIIENKQCEVTILIDNPQRKIRSGSFAMAKLDSKIYKDRLLVPKEAVTDRSGRMTIFIIRDGVARWNYVTLGLQNDEYWEILSTEQETLIPGDWVITVGNTNIAHDVPVRVVNQIK